MAEKAKIVKMHVAYVKPVDVAEMIKDRIMKKKYKIKKLKP